MSTKENIIKQFGIASGQKEDMKTPNHLEAYRQADARGFTNLLDQNRADNGPSPEHLKALVKQDPMRARIIESMNSLSH